jgi:KDO2-lipid IV(A) lauroyltransferase
MYIFLKLIETIANIIPYNLVIKIGSGIGLLGYFLSSKHRKLATSNIIRALNISLPEAERIAKESFRNIGINMAEFLVGCNKPLNVVGYENIDQKNGNIFVLGHFGNWEILGRIAIEHGMKITAVGRGIKDQGADKYIRNKREFAGLEILDKKGSFKYLLQALKEKKSAGILIDQYAGRKGVFVDFFGIPTSTTASPVLLSFRTGCRIVPVFIIRKETEVEIILESPLKLTKTGDIQKDVQTGVQAMVKPLEKYVKMYPEKWWWVHRRWR